MLKSKKSDKKTGASGSTQKRGESNDDNILNEK